MFPRKETMFHKGHITAEPESSLCQYLKTNLGELTYCVGNVLRTELVGSDLFINFSWSEQVSNISWNILRK